MATGVHVANFEFTSADSGTRDLVHPSTIGTPKGAIFLVSDVATPGTIKTDLGFACGFAGPDPVSGNNGFVMGVAQEDGDSESDPHRYRAGAQTCIMCIGPAGVEDGAYGFNSFIADGVRLDVDDAPSRDFQVTVIFFVGSDVQISCGEAESGSSGDPHNLDIDPGFVADLFFIATTRTGTLPFPSNPASGTWASLCLGVAANKSGFPQGCITHAYRPAATTLQAGALHNDETMVNHNNLGTENLGLDVTSFTIDNGSGAREVRLNVNGPEASSASKVFTWFAVKVGTDVNVVHGDVPTSGNGTYNVGFKAQAGGVLASLYTSVNAYDLGAPNSAHGCGFFDDTDEGGSSWQSEDGVATTNSNQNHEAKCVAMLDSVGAAGYEGTISSLTSPNVVIAYTNHPASVTKMLVWAIKEDVAGTPVSNSVTGQAESLEGIASLNVGQAESLNRLFPAVTGEAEGLATVLQTNVGQVETLQGIVAPETGQSESLQGIFAPETGQAESLQEITASKTGQAESLQGIVAPETGQSESLQGIAAPGTGQAESLQKIFAPATGQAELDPGSVVSSTVTGQSEALQGIVNPEVGQVESLQEIAASETGQVEALQGIEAPKTGQVEVLQGIEAPKTGQVESIQEIVSPTTGQAEVDPGAVVSSTVTGQAEALQGIIDSVVGQAESLLAIPAPVTGQVEVIQIVIATTTGQVGCLQGIVAPVVGQAEISGAAAITLSVDLGKIVLNQGPTKIILDQSATKIVLDI